MYSDGGSKDPELKKHLLAAKRAASTLFPGDQPKKKARKSRWSEESTKMVLPGLPTVLPANMKEDEQKLYLSECMRCVASRLFQRVSLCTCIGYTLQSACRDSLGDFSEMGLFW